jgi:methyl-accepting chemotaxis protein
MKISVSDIRKHIAATILETVVITFLLATASMYYSFAQSSELRERWFVSSAVRFVSMIIGGGIVQLLFDRTIPTIRSVVYGGLPVTQENAVKMVEESQDMAIRQALLVFGVSVITAFAGGFAFIALTNASMSASIQFVYAAVLFSPLASLFLVARLELFALTIVQWSSQETSPESVMKASRRSEINLEPLIVFATTLWVALPMLANVTVVATQLGELSAMLATTPDPALHREVTVDRLLWLCGWIAPISLLCGVCALRAASVTAALISRPLQTIATQADSFMASGQSPTWLSGGQGELWALVGGFTRLVRKLGIANQEIQPAAEKIEKSNTLIQTISARFEKGASEQAQALHETTVTTEELLQAAGHIAENAAAVQDFARATSQAALEGSANAESFRQSVDRIAREDGAMLTALLRLGDRVAQIGKTLDEITAVARRSELLALSADLEGTRAGESGRNFSRVASEMRRLSENILDSTAEVGQLVDEVQREARETAEIARSSSLRLLKSETLSTEIVQALLDTAQTARQTADAARTISLSTQQQQTGTDQLSESMADVLGSTQQSLFSVQQLSTANARIESVVGRLRAVSLVSRTKKNAKETIKKTKSM